MKRIFATGGRVSGKHHFYVALPIGVRYNPHVGLIPRHEQATTTSQRLTWLVPSSAADRSKSGTERIGVLSAPPALCAGLITRPKGQAT
jgi:hypothetical protein